MKEGHELGPIDLWVRPGGKPSICGLLIVRFLVSHQLAVPSVCTVCTVCTMWQVWAICRTRPPSHHYSMVIFNFIIPFHFHWNTSNIMKQLTWIDFVSVLQGRLIRCPTSKHPVETWKRKKERKKEKKTRKKKSYQTYDAVVAVDDTGGRRQRRRRLRRPQ